MLRSLLFVPAKERMLNKIASFTADGYIIDLEDSINNEEKVDALSIIRSFLERNKELSNIYIRLNKGRYKEEAGALDCFNVGFVLPKFETPNEYNELESIWKRHMLIALVETPKGIVNIQAIAECSWVNSIAFGAEDYTASVNMRNDNAVLLPVKSTIVVHAKACNKMVYDTPSFKLNDESAFEQEVQIALDLGFDGKLAISPKHIQFINETFKACDMDYILSIIARYEAEGNAVVVIDGKVYERMHINRLKRIIKENSYNS